MSDLASLTQPRRVFNFSSVNVFGSRPRYRWSEINEEQSNLKLNELGTDKRFSLSERTLRDRRFRDSIVPDPLIGMHPGSK